MIWPKDRVALAHVTPIGEIDRHDESNGSRAKRIRLGKCFRLKIKREEEKERKRTNEENSITEEEITIEGQIAEGTYDSLEDLPLSNKKAIRRNKHLNDLPIKFKAISKILKK